MTAQREAPPAPIKNGNKSLLPDLKRGLSDVHAAVHRQNLARHIIRQR